MKKIITVLLTATLLIARSAYAADNEKEFLRLSRLNSKEGAKNICISNWANNEDNNKILTRTGITVRELCSCTEQEVDYMVTDDLANRLMYALIEVDRAKKNNEKFETQQAITEWNSIYNAANRSCGEKLLHSK